MRIGILGSGNVGQALAIGFLAEGHEVWLATREPDSEKAQALKRDFPQAHVDTFKETAKQAEIAVLCTPWDAAADAIKLAGSHHLDYKILIDTNNALQHRPGRVVQVVGVGWSAGEVVQEWLPHTQVVKCFNTTGHENFYKPQFESTPTMFLAGDHEKGKKRVAELVTAFGWEPLDAGGIEASRELESMAVLWVNHLMRTEDPHHAFKML